MMQSGEIIVLSFAFLLFFFFLCLKLILLALYSIAEQLTTQTGSERGLESFCFRTEDRSEDRLFFIYFCNESPPDNTYRMKKKRWKTHSSRTVLDKINKKKISGRDFKSESNQDISRHRNWTQQTQDWRECKIQIGNHIYIFALS